MKDLNIETFKCSKKCQENDTHCAANKIKFVQFASQEFNYGGLIKKSVASADKELIPPCELLEHLQSFHVIFPKYRFNVAHTKAQADPY